MEIWKSSDSLYAGHRAQLFQWTCVFTDKSRRFEFAHPYLNTHSKRMSEMVSFLSVWMILCKVMDGRYTALLSTFPQETLVLVLLLFCANIHTPLQRRLRSRTRRHFQSPLFHSVLFTTPGGCMAVCSFTSFLCNTWLSW